ncbi:MAG: hypothetical protein K2X29_01680 [Candidatus Obscuribacterales bacterium]|nr:hypothetical protein [Candidatus Obscuribacterales bacterium]
MDTNPCQLCGKPALVDASLCQMCMDTQTSKTTPVTAKSISTLIYRALVSLVLGSIMVILGLAGTCAVIIGVIMAPNSWQTTTAAVVVGGLALFFAYLLFRLIRWMFESPPKRLK